VGGEEQESSSTGSRRSRVHISIFHTNDMHGRLDAMSRLSSFARRLRAEAEDEGRAVFLWDAGDAADRRVRTCSITKGAAFSPILNAMGYTLQTMGNAVSLPYGPQAMAAVADRAGFPILAANCRDDDSPLPEGLQEYVLLPLSRGPTMGVFGLTAPWEGMYEIFGLHFPGAVAVARRLVKTLRTEGATLIVLLSHLGLDDDRKLIDAVDGIDLVIGGHSHTRLPSGEMRRGALLAQAGQYAEALGRVDLTLDACSGRILESSACLLEVPGDEPADPRVKRAIAAAEAEVELIMRQPVGVLESPLDLDHFAECGIGNFTADVLRERMNAEIAMICSGQFHRGLPAGTITFGQLDAACFSSANPCVSEVLGAQIVEALERSLNPEISKVAHHGFRGTPIGLLQISGMVVEHDPDGSVSSRVKRVMVQGRPIEADRVYRVAHTDAEPSRSVGYLVLEEGQPSKHEVPTIVREAMEEHIRRHSPVPPPERGRWVVTSGQPS
jgi:5'-nucleotidase